MALVEGLLFVIDVLKINARDEDEFTNRTIYYFLVFGVFRLSYFG